MKGTGIIRRIDDLGRISLPKDIRRSLQLREGDPIEIFLGEDNTVCLKKYQPLGEISNDEGITVFVTEASKVFGVDIVVADRDGNIMQSTLHHLRGRKLDEAATLYCEGYGKEEDIPALYCGLYVSNAVSGIARVKLQTTDIRTEGAVFVCGESAYGTQLARLLAAVIAQKYSEYI